MGLLSLGRAIGRAIGKGVEGFGKLVGSKKFRKSDVIFKMPAVKRPWIQADSMNTIRIRRRNAKHGRLRIFCRAFRLA